MTREAVYISLPGTAPRYFRLLLPVWLFSAFLTGVSFIPGIRNNLGPFELIGVFLIAAFVLIEPKFRDTFRHPLISVTIVMVLLATATQFRIPASRSVFAFIQVVILIFMLFFFVMMRHFVDRYHISPESILKIIVLSVLIIGPWVYLDGMTSNSGIQAAGPFRNRAHMANYMLSAFWLVAMYLQWPVRNRLLRSLAYAAAGLSLYAIAVSGRRSVYLSLLLGLAIWACSVLAPRKNRLKLLVSVLAVFGLLFGLYRYAHVFGSQGLFFKQRIGMIDDRLKSATSLGDEVSDSGFYQLQRQGVASAVRAAPIFGIGWGGFAKSAYSPTGHEVHSTPLRFLAELGFIGLALYSFFIGYLLYTSITLFLRMRESPYGTAFLVLAVATWSMTISHAYNRHITERTFWIYVAVFLALELFARDWMRLQDLARSGELRELTEHTPDHVSPTEHRAHRLSAVPGAAEF